MRETEDSGSDPRISAIIPAYNRESTIERAIRSVLAQTVAPAEVIVVDDGSTDGTREAVNGFGPQVQYFHQANRGAAVARNRGVAEASSEWVAFLDSDDFWQEQHLERVATAIQGTMGRALVYFADTRRPPEEGSVLLWDACGFSIKDPYELIECGKEWVMLSRQPMMLQSSVLHRAAYLASGGLCETLLTREDTHLLFRLCIANPCCAVSGYGTVMTADDRNGRLTSRYSDKSRVYWESTVWLYRDILSGRYPLSSGDRRRLRGRLASAHLRLARLAWTAHAAFEACLHLVRAFYSSPQRVFAGVRRRLRAGGDPPGG